MPIQPSEATDGPWTPETRPHLKAVIDYLETPAAGDAVARLAAIKPGACRLTSAGAKSLRRAFWFLSAWARYTMPNEARVMRP
jgi:hypothetical protein